MLATDAQLDLRTGTPPFLARHFHESANSLLVQHLKWIDLQNASRNVVRDELTGIVTRETERRLGQIVRAERKELADLGDLVRDHARARQFDHSSGGILHLDTSFAEDLLGHAIDNDLLFLKCLRTADE